MFTDPPYNVAIDGNVCGLGRIRHREFATGCGEMSEVEFTTFLKTVFDRADGKQLPNGACGRTSTASSAASQAAASDAEYKVGGKSAVHHASGEAFETIEEQRAAPPAACLIKPVPSRLTREKR